MILYSGFESNLYEKIQTVATNLGYINAKSREIVLSNKDYLKVSDKIWEWVISGYLAPGLNKDNPWFPKIHLTEKGKKLIED